MAKQRTKKEKIKSIELVHLGTRKVEYSADTTHYMTCTIKVHTTHEWNNVFDFDLEQFIDGYTRLDPYVDLRGKLHEIETSLPILKDAIALINAQTETLLIHKLRAACPILERKTEDGRRQIIELSKRITEIESLAVAKRFASYANHSVIESPQENNTAESN